MVTNPARLFHACERVRSVAGVLTALVVIMTSLVVVAPAGAHADLTSTDPANASTASTPVETITFTFSKASEAVPELFTITGPDGPVGVSSVRAESDDTVVVVEPERALTGGRYRVGWGIRAGDTHRMTGAISFTVDAAADAPASPTEPAAAPSTTVPEAPANSVVPPTTIAATEIAAPPLVDADQTSTFDDAAAVATPLADRVATLLRGLLYLLMLVTIGGVVYLAAVHRGTRRESEGLVAIVRGAAIGVATLAVAAFVVQLAVADNGAWTAVIDPSAWSDVVTGGMGPAALLRLLGGVAVVMFVGTSSTRLPSATAGDASEPGAPVPVASGGGAAPTGTVVRRRRRGTEQVRVASSPLVWLGVAFLAASESFLGHTADTAPRPAMLISDAVHLVAGGIWLGGALLLVVTLRRRRRASGTSVAPLVARYSWLAGWSVAAVALTGVVMGALILGDLSALISSTFGRLLLVKIALVVGLVAAGAYNRNVLLPELEAGTDDGWAIGRLRASLSIELVLFVAVVVLTAVLVNANPN